MSAHTPGPRLDASTEDAAIILRIGQRASALMAGQLGTIALVMDVTACHLNGCPLHLEDLAEADNFNLLHDVVGIYRHLDRETGRLKDCFLPRYAKAGSR